ncbi:MAG TPA: hypothetical protein VHX86_10820 [Tepidisphaeraceae bacterium]|jgi:hypothetical protein|nr:hypothetical protein [Tepidisphaeraceae bacterium]
MSKRRLYKVYKEPPALRHLRRTLTEKMSRGAFYDVFGREPHSDQELAMFVEQYTLEMYNSGHDEWLRR